MNSLKLFESKRIRSHWDAENEQWYFAIVDVIAILTDSPNPQVYWRVLKKRLKAEGNESVTNCNALKMEAPDGKQRLTDVADRARMKIPSVLLHRILNFEIEQYGNSKLHSNKINR